MTQPPRRAPATRKGIRIPVPRTRDPFVNTPLRSIGPGADGVERFWISTWNATSGCLATLVTEDGRHRIYRFPEFGGFYSMAQEDADTLWLCNMLSSVVRLSLGTGRYETFQTGAPHALMFQGMILDPPTGKLFAAAYPPPDTAAFVFDIRTRKPVKVFDNIGPDRYADHYMRFSFPNGDGTWSFVLHCPGESFGRWDPRTDTVELRRFNDGLDTEDMSQGTTYSLIPGDPGWRYVPGRGWYDGKSGVFTPAPVPPRREMTWFDRLGDTAWGASGQGPLEVGAWNLATGDVRIVCSIPDLPHHNIALARSGKLMAVTLYGDLLRLDGMTGALELSRRLPTDSVGSSDCISRLDKHRLLGTPFITQRFWEVNLKTRRGVDCGRAAPGLGQICRTCAVGGKVYMAAYTGGELVEYDPAQPARFPENPRVVADPPHGMRPEAIADDGRRVFYACNHEYGRLGCVVTRYDTKTGDARYHDDPVPGQQIRSLVYDRATRSLVAGTTLHGDCQSAVPTSDRCFFVRLDADTRAVRGQEPAPAGTELAHVAGPMGPGRVLGMCHGTLAGGSRAWRCFTFDVRTGAVPEAEAMRALPDGLWSVVATGRPGLFVLGGADRWELWDLRTWRSLSVLCRESGVHRAYVQDRSVYLVRAKEIVVLDDVLPARHR